MSQQSQASNSSLGEPMLSQETFNEVFSNISQIFNQQDLQGIQTDYQMAPISLQMAEESVHENYEMELVCANVRQETCEFPPYVSDQNFTQPTSKAVEAASFKREAITCKEEHIENGLMPLPPKMPTPPPEQAIPQPLIVSNTDFPGLYGFDVGFDQEKSPPTKSAHWTYSPYLDKLFLKMRCIIPFRLKLQVFPPSPGFHVRVVVIYRQPEHYREIVERCPNHMTRQKDGHPAPKHLLRCENPQTVYMTCPETGRHSLRFPLGIPQAGSDFLTEMFQFMCFSSCPGGLNRRPILVIFTLEYGNQVLGRKAQNIRICACPGRDRGIEETAESKKRVAMNNNSMLRTTTEPQDNQVVCTSTPNTTPPPTLQESSSSAPRTPPAVEPTASTSGGKTSDKPLPKLTKKRSHTLMSSGFEVRQLNLDRNPLSKKQRTQEEEVFSIQVKGREKYELLLKIKESLDLMDLVPQAQIDRYRQSCPPCGKVRNSQNSQSSENVDSQNSNDTDDVDGTPQSCSQLSRSDSGSSYQSPASSQQSSGGGTGINAVRFTLRRTMSLEKKGYHHVEVS